MADGLIQEIRDKWLQIIAFVEESFDKKPDLNAILFLIGVRELGELRDTPFSKEEKVHLKLELYNGDKLIEETSTNFQGPRNFN